MPMVIPSFSCATTWAAVICLFIACFLALDNYFLPPIQVLADDPRHAVIVFDEVDTERALRAAHALDLQGLTRCVVAGRVEAAVDPRVRTILPRGAWIKGSADEWRLVGAGIDGCADAERLVTRGIDGGELIAAAVTHRWRADPPIDHCDPTGAGDVHFAAYLAHRAHGDAPEAAAAAAARFTSAFLASPT